MGFGQEIKDFLGAYAAMDKMSTAASEREYRATQNEALKLKTERENDPEALALEQEKARLGVEGARINNEGARARIGGTHASTAATQARTQLINEQLKQYRELIKNAGGGGGSGLLTGFRPQAVEIDETPAFADGGLVTRDGKRLDEDDPRGPPVEVRRDWSNAPRREQSRGAIEVLTEKQFETDKHGRPVYRDGKRVPVRYYENGGLVEEDDDTDVESEEAIPLSAEPTQGVYSPAGASERALTRRQQDMLPPGLADMAVKHGLQFGINAAGLDQRTAIRSPRQLAAAQQLARGAGGLTGEELAAVKKQVDPQGRLSEGKRNMAALGAVYKFQMDKGNVEGAQRVAFQFLQHYRVATQRYAALAAQALQGGDMDTAAKAAMRAYANIPDGRDIKIEVDPATKRMKYTYTDEETGKTISKGVITPEQFGQQVMGLAGGGFDKQLLMAAGAREKEKKEPKALAMSERAAVGRRLGTEGKEDEIGNSPLAKMRAADTAAREKANLPPRDDQYWDMLGNTSQRIIAGNTDMTPNEAARASAKLYEIMDKDPEKLPFKVTPGDDGTATIKINGIPSFTMGRRDMEPILEMRAEAIAARRAKDKAKAEEDAKPGLGSMALDLGKELVTGAPGRLKDLYNAPQRGVDLGVKAVDSAISLGDKAIQGARRVLRYPENAP